MGLCPSNNTTVTDDRISATLPPKKLHQIFLDLALSLHHYAEPKVIVFPPINTKCNFHFTQCFRLVDQHRIMFESSQKTFEKILEILFIKPISKHT